MIGFQALKPLQIILPSIMLPRNGSRASRSQREEETGGGRSRGWAGVPAFAGHGLRRGLERDWMAEEVWGRLTQPDAICPLHPP